MAPSSVSTARQIRSGDDSWQKALDRLDPDLKTALTSVSTRKVDVVSAVLRAADDKRQLCIRKQWRFTSPNGRVIVVRDVLEKLVSWIDRYKAVGDVVSQYDPVNAAVPWAAFRFLLNVASGDIQAFGLMVTVLEAVARIIARSKIIEEVCIRGPSPTNLVQPLGECSRLVVRRRSGAVGQVCQVLWSFYRRSVYPELYCPYISIPHTTQPVPSLALGNYRSAMTT
jgi:hypothetical protein